MLHKLFEWFRKTFSAGKAGDYLPERTSGVQKYRIVLLSSRTEAQKAALVLGIVALLGTREKQKWAYFLCPCGCGNQVALNLMASQHPFWKVSIQNEKRFSIYPSIHSTTCGAHFWLKDGRVTWCD